MKNIFFFLCLAIGNFVLHAQDGKLELGVSVALGSSPLSLPTTEVFFRYVDESPSMDNIRTYFALPEQKGRSFSGRGGLYLIAGKWQATVNVNATRGNGTHVWGSDAGVGYNLTANKKVHIIPNLNVGVGFTAIDLGNIKNNSVYIQVNDVLFYSSTVAVDMRTSVWTVRPGLRLEAPFSIWNQPIAITVEALLIREFAYGKPLLGFEGQGESGQDLTSSESVDADNVLLSINQGEPFTKSLISVNGTAFSVGIRWAFN